MTDEKVRRATLGHDKEAVESAKLAIRADLSFFGPNITRKELAHYLIKTGMRILADAIIDSTRRNTVL